MAETKSKTRVLSESGSQGDRVRLAVPTVTVWFSYRGQVEPYSLSRVKMTCLFLRSVVGTLPNIWRDLHVRLHRVILFAGLANVPRRWLPPWRSEVSSMGQPGPAVPTVISFQSQALKLTYKTLALRNSIFRDRVCASVRRKHRGEAVSVMEDLIDREAERSYNASRENPMDEPWNIGAPYTGYRLEDLVIGDPNASFEHNEHLDEFSSHTEYARGFECYGSTGCVLRFFAFGLNTHSHDDIGGATELVGPSEGQLYVEREGKAEKVCEWEEDRATFVVRTRVKRIAAMLGSEWRSLSAMTFVSRVLSQVRFRCDEDRDIVLRSDGQTVTEEQADSAHLNKLERRVLAAWLSRNHKAVSAAYEANWYHRPLYAFAWSDEMNETRNLLLLTDPE